MPKKQQKFVDLNIKRPERAKLSAAKSLKRMQTFRQRKERFVAAVREGKNRNLPA